MKVSIERAASSKMAEQNQLEEKKLLELQIFDDIQDIYDTHILDELDGLEELEDVLAEVSMLTKKFRHIHVELKYRLGNDYNDSYPEFDKRLEGLRKYTTSVKQKIKLLNSSKAADENEALISSLMIEEKVLHDRLEKELLTFEVEKFSKIDEISERCSKLEHLLEDYYRLLSKAKIGLAEGFDAVFETKFDEMIDSINQKVDAGKAKIKIIESGLKEAAIKEKADHEEQV